MEVGTPQSITSSFGTILFNDFAGAGLDLPPDNGYLLQSIPGNECPTIRSPKQNKPGKSGGLLHPWFKSVKLIVLEGLVVTTKPDYRTVLDDHLRGVTDPGLKQDMTYTWSLPPAPYSVTRFHTVRLYTAVEIRNQPQLDGMPASPKLFHIELIAYKTDEEVGY